MRRVLVTGIGVISPIGIGKEAFWHALEKGATGIVPALPDQAAAGARVVAPVREFREKSFVKDERTIRVLGRIFALLLGAAALAVADANLESVSIEEARLGISCGVGPIDQYSSDLLSAAVESVEDGKFVLSLFAAAIHLLHPFRRLRLLPNTGCALLSIRHHAGGPSFTFVSGHTAGLQAIREGLAMIRSDRADAVLCGGADSQLTPMALRVFGRTTPLSASEDPDTACRPFDRAREGVVAAEGATMLLLEAEDSARKRGVRAQAELLSAATAFYGAANPPIGIQLQQQSHDACEEAIRRVLDDAAGPPDAVVSHGDGGIESDRREAQALGKVSPASITSIQAAVGHTMSASGPLNVATACLMLRHQRIPPIRSLQHPEMDLPFVKERAVARSLRRVLTNTLGPEGAASALLARVDS